MKARIITVVVALTAVAAMLIPTTAGAHQADAYHLHGWSSLTKYLNGGSELTCGNTTPTMYGTRDPGYVRIAFPDVMTSPASALVYFTARLEKWQGNYQGQDVWHTVGAEQPWIMARANQTSLQSNWMNMNGNYLFNQNNFGWNVQSGFYRVAVFYYWGYDGTYFQTDKTGWCQVG